MYSALWLTFSNALDKSIAKTTFADIVANDITDSVDSISTPYTFLKTELIA